MKVLSVLGTRPEIIRLCRIIEKLDAVCEHILVHTGQNYEATLNDIFFKDLMIRAPDEFLDAKGGFGEQVGIILEKIEKILLKEKPDKFLVLGDTNSALAAIVAKRLGIPVYHLEAGNRCYDDRVPEEVNRRIIDHSSDILMPYTERSRQNLLREGIPGQRIHVIGNPIFEVINSFESQIHASEIHARLGVRRRGYFLVTLHRAENVDLEERLHKFILALEQIEEKYQLPIIVSTHPRTKNKLRDFAINIANERIRFMEPFGFFDFILLEKEAYCVLSDSGTVQEECAILKVPNITLRDVTERPETIECGSNILAGSDPETILLCVAAALSKPVNWRPPVEYLSSNVSNTVINILAGEYHKSQ